MQTDIKELVELALKLDMPLPPKRKPHYRLSIIVSRDWIAVYHSTWEGPLFRKYPTNQDFNALNVQELLEDAGHFAYIE